MRESLRLSPANGLERLMPRTATTHFRGPLVVFPRIGFRAADLVDLVLTWVEVARQRRHLAALDNRMLSDIGFSRADVEREIERPFWDVCRRDR